jgi:hypothetical protein
MSDVAAFEPQGATVLIGVSALQVPSSNISQRSCRVRCLVSAYLTWGATSGVAAVGGPGANTIGMTAGTVESFIFPANSFFISNVAASFEISPGEGL